MSHSALLLSSDAALSLLLLRVFRYKKLEDLLEKSFSLVKMPSIQPVVMCVMKHLPKVRPLRRSAGAATLRGITRLSCASAGLSAPSADLLPASHSA